MTYNPGRRRKSTLRHPDHNYTEPGVYFVTVCTRDKVHLFGHVEGERVMLNGYGRIVQGAIRRIPRHTGNVQIDAFVVMPNHIHMVLVIEERTGNTHPSPRRGEASAMTGTPMPSFSDGDPGVSPRTTSDASPAAPPSSGIDASARVRTEGEASEAGGSFPPLTADGGGGSGEFGIADASPLRDHGGNATCGARGGGTTPGSVGAVVQSLKSVTTRAINRRRGTPGARVWQRGYYDRIVRSDRALKQVRRYVAENPARWSERGHGAGAA